MKIVPCLLLLMALPVSAAVVPRPNPQGDPHIGYVNWQRDQVVRVVGCLGMGTTVRFGDQDQIDHSRSVIPYRRAWSKLENNAPNELVLMPIHRAGDNPTTNMRVMMRNGREYYLELTTINDGGDTCRSSGKFFWTIRYLFTKYVQDDPASRKTAGIATTTRNYRYSGCGARSLWPYRVWDDGKFVYIVWTREQGVPMVGIVDDAGIEHAYSPEIVNGVVVIHRLVPKITIRVADTPAGTACVKRDDPIGGSE